MCIRDSRRVLKKNGFFVTQQVGGENDLPLVKRLCQGFPGSFVGFNLENELPRFRQAGFRVMRSDQAYVESRYLDVGAVVFLSLIHISPRRLSRPCGTSSSRCAPGATAP